MSERARWCEVLPPSLARAPPLPLPHSFSELKLLTTTNRSKTKTLPKTPFIFIKHTTFLALRYVLETILTAQAVSTEGNYLLC